MCTRACFLAGISAVAAAPLTALAKSEAPQYLELAVPGMRQIGESTWVAQISPHVWVHTTTSILQGETGYYPANGVVVENDGSALLIDTGWHPSQTETLLRFWRDIRRVPVKGAFVTHFHNDRLGGVDLLKSHGVAALASPATVELASSHHEPLPKPLEGLEQEPKSLGAASAYFPGAGHTRDNTVVFVPSDNVLFGGCLIKSVTAPDLGYLADAVIPSWPATMRNVQKRYHNAATVIPGHGTIKGDSIAYTIRLADAAAGHR